MTEEKKFPLPFNLIYHKIYFFKTNWINSLLNKSLRTFLKDIFLFWGLWNFYNSKTLFFDLHQVKVIRYHHYLML